MNSTKTSLTGLAYGLAAYAVWGVLPLFFSTLTPFVTPAELLAHRLVWGMICLSLALTVNHRWKGVCSALRDQKTRWLLVLSATLVTANWLAFLFAVSSGNIRESSLGYFVTPLVSIALGVLIFRERLRGAAQFALALTLIGIILLIVMLGAFPRIAFVIAISFGLYGMVRKIAQVDGLVGLFIETALLTPFAIAYLLFQATAGAGVVAAGNWSALGLLIFSGALTAVPMVWYGEATRTLKLTTLGFLQYVLPALQLLQAVVVFGEPFPLQQQICFCLIWTALAAVILDSVISQHTAAVDHKLPGGSAAAIRSEWRTRLPVWLQPFLTWLMGYPFQRQRPLWTARPWWVVMMLPALLVLSGAALSISAIHVGGWALFALPMGWMLIVAGARTLQVHICHQGVHHNLTGVPRWDRWFVEVISTLLFVQDYESYQHDHDGFHHPALASEHDADRRFIMDVMRLQAGASKAGNLRRFYGALVSPRVHATLLRGRFQANFVTCPPYRRLMSIVWLLTIVWAVSAAQLWTEFLLGCVLPLTVFYHVSAMCQFVTEHFWARQRKSNAARQNYLALLLNRHLGDPLPHPELQGRAWWLEWLVWWLRLVLYHTPFRLVVLVADLPVHGSHHLWPRDKNWANAIFRYHQLAERSGKFPNEFVGGFLAIVDHVLESFQESPEATDSNPAPPPGKPARQSSHSR